MSFRHFTSTSMLIAVVLTAAGLAISVTTSSAATVDEGLVVHYDLTQSSSAAVRGAGDIWLPDKVIDGLTDVTVSVEAELAQGWRTITCTLGDGTSTVYEDGVLVARTTGVATGPGRTADHLGRAVDQYLKGNVRDFRLYSRALSAGEARELGKTTASARPAVDLAALDLGDISAVAADLTLPAKSSGGSAISWTSNRPSVLSAAGVVTRPAPREGSSTATLTATAAYAGYTATRDFSVTVLEDITDRQKVDNALKDVVIHDEDEIRGDLTLPVKGARDVTFAWQSSDPRVVTATGEVTRPPYGSRPRTARLSVRATKGYTSATRYFTLTVLPLPKKAAMEGYLFAHVADEGTQVRLAVSRGNDLLQWDEVKGRPAVKSKYELRDPFIVRGPEGDRFFLVATRLLSNDAQDLEVWESTDLVTWSEQRQAPGQNWDDPGQIVIGGRSGAVLPVSKAELERVRKGPSPVRANKKGVLVDYDLTDGSGPAVADLSGNGRTATIRGDITRSSAGLVFGGKEGHLDLPDDLTNGLDQLTVSAQVWIDGAAKENWRTITYTVSNGSALLFDDTVEFARLAGVVPSPDELSGITTSFAGTQFRGKMRRLTVWNRVMTAAEVLASQPR